MDGQSRLTSVVPYSSLIKCPNGCRPPAARNHLGGRRGLSGRWELCDAVQFFDRVQRLSSTGQSESGRLLPVEGAERPRGARRRALVSRVVGVIIDHARKRQGVHIRRRPALLAVTSSGRLWWLSPRAGRREDAGAPVLTMIITRHCRYVTCGEYHRYLRHTSRRWLAWLKMRPASRDPGTIYPDSGRLAPPIHQRDNTALARQSPAPASVFSP